MRRFGWLLRRLTEWAGIQAGTSSARQELITQLRVTRLEERRVLHADVASTQQLIVDAGAAANDGQADTFRIERAADELQISVNGELVSKTPLEQFDAITIRGSLDDDRVIADFQGGDPFTHADLLVDGGAGGHNSLQLTGGSAVESVHHEISQPESGRLEINSANPQTQIKYQSVQTIRDLLTAEVRDFRFVGDTNHVSLADADQPGDDLSRVSWTAAVAADPALLITFDNPLGALSIEVAGAPHESDSVEVVGLDSGFDADLGIQGAVHSWVMFNGATDVGSGDVHVTSGRVEVNDTISTAAAAVHMRAVDELTITDSGLIQNPGGVVEVQAVSIAHEGSIVAAGGHVTLDSGDVGVTSVSGLIDVASTDAEATGGTVHVLGMHVGLFDEARIEASGIAGGGVVLIGGDYQGQNPHIRNAQRTFVGSATAIRSDAIAMGDGGRVIVWADEWTRFHGSINARGGADGGDGGFAEVSGKQSLVFGGTTDLTASRGQMGTLLLDPVDIVIEGGVTNAGGGAGTDDDLPTINFNDAPIAGTTTVTEAGLEAQATNIVLQAQNSITVSGTFNQDSNGEGTGSIVRLRDGVSLTMDTRNALGDGSGGIDLTAGGTIGVEFQTTGNADIDIRAASDGGAAGTAPLRVGRLTTRDSITGPTGSITLRAEGAVVVDGPLTTGNVMTTGDASGSISIISDTATITVNDDLITGDAIVPDAAGISTATTGDIDLMALAGISGAGSLTTGSAQVDAATADAVDTATSGSITVNVTGTGDVGLSGAPGLGIGSATVVNNTTNDVAMTGNITVIADRVNNGTPGTALQITFGAATGAQTNTAGTLSATTDGGPAGAGEVVIAATTGDIVLANNAIDTGTGGDVSLIAAGTIRTSQGNDGTAEITSSTNAYDVSLTADSIGVDAASADSALQILGVDALTATLSLTSTGAGNVNVDELTTAMFLNLEVDAQTQDDKTYIIGLVGDGDQTFAHAGGTMLTIATGGIAFGTNDRNFTLAQAGSDITLQDNAIDAGSGNVSLTSTGGSINVTATNGTPEITTNSAVDLAATTGIGSAMTLELAAMTIAADNTTSGDVDLSNTFATDVFVTSLTTAGGGIIRFEQSGGGNVDFGTVSTTTDGSPAAGEDDSTLR